MDSLNVCNEATAGLTIRLALPEDFAAIAAIYNQAIAHGNITMDCDEYTAATVGAVVKKLGDRGALLVATQTDRVIGWGIIKEYSDRAGYQVCCETSIYLDDQETGKGYGNYLQTVLINWVKTFNYHHIVAKILADNAGSIRFHQRFGFEIVGVQKEIGFLNGRWHDVVIMQRLLP